MERLTRRDKVDGNEFVRINKGTPDFIAYEKLAEYEDFEEIFRLKMTDYICEVLKDKEEFAKWLDRNKKTAKKCDEYVGAEEQGELLKLPCAVGDYALFSGGTIIPVIYITLSANGHITVGCQNGIRVSVDSMWGNSGSSCKGFFRTEEEAGAAWEELRKRQEAYN